MMVMMMRKAGAYRIMEIIMSLPQMMTIQSRYFPCSILCHHVSYMYHRSLWESPDYDADDVQDESRRIEDHGDADESSQDDDNPI